MITLQSVGRGSLLALVLVATASGRALANGAFPDSLEVLLPLDRPSEIGLATNFGLILSEDTGQTWQWVCEVEALTSANFYQVGPPPLDRLFAVSTAGIASSDDRACSWQVAGGQVAGALAQDVFADPANAQHVLGIAVPSMGSSHGPTAVFESSDGGLTFDRKLYQAGSTADGLLGVEVAASDPNVLYVPWYSTPGVHPKLARTQDGGATWETIDLEPSVGTSYVWIIAIDRDNPQRIYLRINGSPYEELGISDDGGTTVTKPLRVKGILAGFAILPSGTIVVGGVDTSAGVAAGAGFRSRDGGLTFEPWPTAPHVRALAQRDGMLFIAGDNANDGFALAVSADEGTTLTPIMSYSDVSAMKACVETMCGPTCNYEAGIGVWPASTCGAYGITGFGGASGSIDQPQGCGCALKRPTAADPTWLAGVVMCALLLRARRRRPEAATKQSLWLLVLLVLSVGLSCHGVVTGQRLTCTGTGDTRSCPVTQSCVWLKVGDGSGYFCGQLCGGGESCPTGQSCKAGAGSSCMTCQDVVDVCE